MHRKGSKKTTAPRKTAQAGREERPEADGVCGRCLLGGAVCRTVEEVLNEVLRKEKQEQRPKPQNKRLRAVLTREVDGQEVNAKHVVFDWLAQELQQRDPQEKRTVVAIMDGENKLRDLQEVKLQRVIGILDIWHVTDYLYDLAYCFHRDGSKEAKAFVETYLRKLLEGKVNRVIGGIRQMATKHNLSDSKWNKVEDSLTYFAARSEYMKYDEYRAAGYPKLRSLTRSGGCNRMLLHRHQRTLLFLPPFGEIRQVRS